MWSMLLDLEKVQEVGDVAGQLVGVVVLLVQRRVVVPPGWNFLRMYPPPLNRMGGVYERLVRLDEIVGG